MLFISISISIGAVQPTLAGGGLEGRVAFVRLTDGFWQVWQRNLASGVENQLTQSASDKRYPEWDDSGGLYFRSNNDELFYLEADGEEEEPFARAAWPALDPVAGPGGVGVVIARLRTDLTDSSALYLVDREGEGSRLLTPGPGLRMHPSWVPGGGGLLYVVSHGASRSEIRRVDRSGGDSVVLINDSSTNLHPALSPVGGLLAYASNRTGDFEIWLHEGDDASGASDVQLTRAAGMDTKPTWSPDGSKLAFATFRNGHFEIWSMAPDGSHQEPLIAGVEDVRDPAWH